MSDSGNHGHRENLLRQREALREQLARIEAEMARARGESSPEDSKPKAPTLGTEIAPSAASEDADALLRRYAADEPRLDPKAVRRGCLLAFAGALALFVAGVAAVYFLFYARR